MNNRAEEYIEQQLRAQAKRDAKTGKEYGNVHGQELQDQKGIERSD
jgi:hypothetical protein